MQKTGGIPNKIKSQARRRNLAYNSIAMSYWHLLAAWKGRISFLYKWSYCQVNHNPVEDNTLKNTLRPQIILEGTEGTVDLARLGE